MEEKDEEEHLNSTQNPLEDTELSVLISTITGNMGNGIWINSKSTTATVIQAEINQEKEVLPLEKQIPEEFHKYLDVFSEEKRHDSLNHAWDHKIEINETFVPKSFKMYNLTNRTGQIFKGQPEQRLYSTFSIPYGITFLLCRQKRRKTSTLPGLLVLILE